MLSDFHLGFFRCTRFFDEFLIRFDFALWCFERNLAIRATEGLAADFFHRFSFERDGFQLFIALKCLVADGLHIFSDRDSRQFFLSFEGLGIDTGDLVGLAGDLHGCRNRSLFQLL